jgi:hypothetical protein
MGILEIVAGALSAVLGILGIVTTTKDTAGRLTRWGAWNLILFVATALIAVAQRVAAVVEESASRYETRAQEREMLTLSSLQLKKATQAITDISRSMNLVPSTFDIAFALSIRCSALSVAVADEICHSYQKMDLIALSPEAQDTLRDFMGLRPGRTGALRLDFWKPDPLRRAVIEGNWTRHADLALEAYLSTDSYFYACNKEGTVVSVLNYDTSAKVVRNSARIRSLDDLPGSRVYVDFSGSRCHWVQRDACVVREIHLETPMGRELLLSGFVPDQNTRGGSVLTFDREFFRGWD